MPLDVNLATASTTGSEPTLVQTGEGTVTDISENVRSAIGSTGGKTTYAFRKDYTVVTMSSDSTSGTTLATIDFNTSIDPEVSNLAQRFILYKFSDITITFKCIAPWSTASGTAQVMVNPDPANPISATQATALLQAMRLLQSRQLSSKGEIEVTVRPMDLSLPVFQEWRYCKPAGYIRAERFGSLAAIVRGAPSTGDGTSWAVTVAGTAEFNMATYNVTSAAFRSDVDLNIIPDLSTVAVGMDDRYILVVPFSSTNQLVNSTGTFIPDNLIYSTLTLGEVGSTYTEIYQLNFGSCKYICVDNVVSLILRLPPQRTTDIETAVINDWTLKQLSGQLIFYDEDFVSGNQLKSSMLSAPIARTHQTPDYFHSSVKSLDINPNIISNLVKKYNTKLSNYKIRYHNAV